MDGELPYRKRLRLRKYDYSRPGCYFVTVCTKVRHENILCRIDAPVGAGAHAGPSPETRQRTDRTPVGAGAHAGPSTETRQRIDRTPVGAGAHAGPSPETRQRTDRTPVGAGAHAGPSTEIRQRTDRTPVGAGAHAGPSSGDLGTGIGALVELTPSGEIVNALIEKIDTAYANVQTDAYVIMPDHVHLILSINASAGFRRLTGDGPAWAPAPTGAIHDGARVSGIPQIISTLKTMASKRIGESIWQRGYYDHIIRTDEELQAIRRYIQSNPQKWLETKGDEPWML